MLNSSQAIYFDDNEKLVKGWVRLKD